MLKEATAKFYFPSWSLIGKHWVVVKFTCGLMPDLRPLVDHVYITYIEHLLDKMRSEASQRYIDTSLLESLYQESAVPLPGSARHNQHINYYDHSGYYWDDDTTPMFTPSKLYLFNRMKEDVTLEHRTPETGVTKCRDLGQPEPNSDTQECAIWIKRPDESVTERLLSLCETISASQPVTDFYFYAGYNSRVSMSRDLGQSKSDTSYSQKCSIRIKIEKSSQMDRMLSLCKTISASQPVTHFHLVRGELTEANVPVMSKQAKSLVLEKVDVSSSVWNYLLQHESLEVLRLESPLHDAAVPLIFNHRNLKDLSLWLAGMFHEMCEYVCHHLRDLAYLEGINLNQNELSRVSSVRLSNTTSPVTLNLFHTHMSPELFKSICQLTSVMKLKKLNLGGNTLTGQLHHLVSEAHQGLQSLEVLILSMTELNKNDIDSLTRAVQGQVLPGLKKLMLSQNILTGQLHHLVSESHQGLQSLEVLILSMTELNKNDIDSLTRAMQRHMLPGLM